MGVRNRLRGTEGKLSPQNSPRTHSETNLLGRTLQDGESKSFRDLTLFIKMVFINKGNERQLVKTLFLLQFYVPKY